MAATTAAVHDACPIDNVRSIGERSETRARRRAAEREPSEQTTRELGDLAVARNLLRLRFCVICHYEMTDEICCTCENPTVLKTNA